MDRAGLKVLVVAGSKEDYFKFHGLLSTSREGRCELSWARSVEEARKAMQHNAYDLCLLGQSWGITKVFQELTLRNSSANATMFLTGNAEQQASAATMGGAGAEYFARNQFRSLPVEPDLHPPAAPQKAAAAMKNSGISHQETLLGDRSELDLIVKLSQLISLAPDTEELFRYVLDYLLRTVRSDVSGAILLTGNRGNIYIMAARALEPRTTRELQRRLIQAFTTMGGKNVQLEACRVHMLEAEASEEAQPPLTTLGSSTEVPLHLDQKDDVVGFLLVASEQVGTLSGINRRVLNKVAHHLSNHIQRWCALLAEEQLRFKSLVDPLREGIVLLDPNGQIILANSAAREHLPSLTNSDVGHILTHLGKRPIREFLIPREEGSQPHEVRVAGPPSKVYEVEARPVPVGPKPGCWGLVIRDKTAEEEILARSQQQERLAVVGQLAAGIAHDFNNTLTGIIGFANYLQNDPQIPDSAKRLLEIIVTQGQRAAQLIRQILSFSRQPILEKCRLDLVPFLKEMAKFLERTIPETITLSLEFEADDYAVYADPTQIQQLVTNLAVNARDAMPGGGRLRLQLSHQLVRAGEHPVISEVPVGDWVVLTVSDTGTGIPPEVLPQIFKPFFTTKMPGEGTGLGLAQVYGIVKQHEGYIDVQSKPGEGTTVSIYLPVVGETHSVVQEDVGPVVKGRGETILVVEDEPLVLDVVRTMLEHLGYQVLAARSGGEALTIYDQHGENISLVLTDMVMPEMYGVTLFEALRSRNPSIRIVVMTGYPLGAETPEFLSEGIVDCLQKPVAFDRLAQVIRQALDEKV